MSIHWKLHRAGRSGPRSLFAGAGHGAALGLALVLLAPGLTGCATKGYVNQRVAETQAATDTRMTAISNDVDAAQARADQAFEKATLAEKLASGAIDYTVVSTHEMHFAFDDFRLDGEAQEVLDALAASLATRPRGVVEIRGHADASGEDRYNYRLGRERAESVERYLVSRHGVTPARIAILSMGEDDPAADNGTEEGRAQNRRVMARLLEITPRAGDVPVAAAP